MPTQPWAERGHTITGPGSYVPSIVSDLQAHESNPKLCLGFKNCSALWLSWDGTGAPLAGHGKTELHAKRNDRIFSMFVCSFVYSFDKCLCFSCATCWGYSRTGQGQRQLSRCCRSSRGWGAPENKQTNKQEMEVMSGR